MKHFCILMTALFFMACSQSKIEKNRTTPYTVEGKSIMVYTTAKDTKDRLSLSPNLSFSPSSQPLETEIAVFVQPEKQFQTFIGIGGAITDASAEVYAQLSPEKQKELIDAYYGEDGIDYSLMRTTIHSCDFSSQSYTYINEGDKELSSFNIDHDRKYRIPMIKTAMAAASDSLLFYVSPWSPPAFMKGKENMLKGGKLLPEYYQSWASYYAKFIKAYEAEGMPIWGLTIQNEPMAVQTWESCVYTAEEERDFLKNYLGPTLQREGLGDKHIVVWDHNRDLISHRANTIFGDPEAAKYAWGIGFHWYERWAGGQSMWDNLRNVKESFPNKNLLFTEGCIEAFNEAEYQRWSNGERYGRAMIQDFNCGTAGWTDWNILLDHTGGPNHVGNYCFSPIHADTRTDSLIYTPSYYYIGHFSKFIRPGAKRVSTSTSRSHLISTSFLNKDGKMVTITMNDSPKNISYKMIVDDYETSLEIPAHGIQTIIY
ncbi:glycoside hydrolase family 30 protein [Saccharicrinis fermentans]|uniref:Glucuronoxylanase XynC n=1 Tax=Saccharicrinis fermentans DSM 9555 = JCM 21142 TaxID=869213 RepID=W7YDN8_9BACT|nr:glycoside hydrolase family 30 protein [Saccharicrinis fermentans]GAF02596.1 glucuronoxylanase XynC precursor [Saccharicrinis fermentans DSM 9555 = JCM 21142]